MTSILETFKFGLKNEDSNLDLSDLEEDVSLRTLCSKTFVNKKTSKRYLFANSNTSHYKKDSQYLDQNLVFTKTSYGWKMHESALELRVPEYSDGQFWIGTLESKIILTFADINRVQGSIDKLLDYESNNGKTVKDELNHRVLYENVYKSTDLKYFCKGYGAYKILYLKDKNCPREFSFVIDIGLLHFDKDSFLPQDEKNVKEKIDTIELKNSNNEVISLFSFPTIKDAGIKFIIPARRVQELGNNKIRINITVSEEFIQNASFPIQIDPSVTIYAASAGGGQYHDDILGTGYLPHPGQAIIEVECQNMHDGSPVCFCNGRHYHGFERLMASFDISSLIIYPNTYLTSCYVYLYCNTVYNCTYTANSRISHLPYAYISDLFGYGAFLACSDYKTLSNAGNTGWHTVEWSGEVQGDINSSYNYTLIGVKQPNSIEQHWVTSETYDCLHTDEQYDANTGNIPYLSISYQSSPPKVILTFTDLHDNRFQLNWNSVAFATAYYIDRYDPVNGWIVGWASTSNIYYVDNTIFQDVQYYYRVRGYNINHPIPLSRYGEYSDQVSGINLISQPTIVNATNLNQGDISITWSLNELYYTHSRVQRKVGAGIWIDLIQLVSGNNTFQDVHVPMDVELRYQVRFERNTYNGANSVFTLAPQTIISSIPPVVNLLISNKNRYKNLISFNSIILPYDFVSLERRINSGTWDVISNLSFGMYSFLDTDVYPQENTYEYRARTYHSDFPTQWTAYTISVPLYLDLSKEGKLRKFFVNDVIKLDTPANY